MLIFCDVSNIAYASYYAMKDQLRDISMSDAALYGILRQLIARVEQNPLVSGVVLVFDSGRNWRYDFYPEYKATRHGTATTDKQVKDAEEKERIRSGVGQALDELRQLCDYLPVYKASRPNTEADELIAALCLGQYSQHQKVIVSNDKDLYQLLRDDLTTQYLTTRRVELTRYNFDLNVTFKDSKKEEIAFPDALTYLQWRFLVGDSSDNITGIPQIGDITAWKLVNTITKRYDGVWDALWERPEGVLAASGVKAIKRPAESIRKCGKEIWQRNMRLMYLLDAHDIIADAFAHVSKPVWNEESRNYLWSWLQYKNFPSILEKFNTFYQLGHSLQTI